MEAIFWLVIIFICIISALAKKKEKKTEEKKSASEIEEKILEALGLKLPRIPVPEEIPQEEILPAPKVKKKIPEKPKAEIPAPPVSVKEKELPKPELVWASKLEEGIVLSEILGPPKAYQILPGWRNG